ncbi:MAG: HEAT repeat domain-containing protein [Planctomycetaceae bacterium]|nr:HEAT repeat domain-containing protein [Planctomycetaceae bacterium]
MKNKNMVLAFALAMLFVCGHVLAQEVNLSVLIADMASDDLGKQQQSQQDWQKICMQAGAPGHAAMLAEVNKQMVEQLGKDIPVVTKAWLLHQMAWTGDARVVPALADLLKNPEVRLREGAAKALAMNTSKEAADALKTALAGETDAANKKRIEDAIASGSTNLNVGGETEMPQALPYVSDADVQKWLAGFDKLSVDDKCRTIAALTVRNDKTYRKYALDAIKSDNDQLKRTGLLALEKLGTTGDLPLLIDSLGFDGGLVIRVATRIAEDGFDDAVMKALLAEKDNGRFEALGRILVDRNVTAVCNVLLTEAKKDDCPNRLGYLQIAAGVATKDDAANMVEVMLLVPVGRDRDRAETIIAGVCKGDAEPVIAGRNPVPPSLFSLLGRMGGDSAREIITQNLKSGNAAVREAALNGLCNWPNAAAANEMLAFAKDTNMPGALRTRALRAYVRVISLPNDQIGIRISPARQLDGLREAMTLANGTPEKQLIIDRASAIRIPESVTFAMQFIDAAALAQNVCNTVAELGRNVDLRRQNSNVLKPALEKVLEVSTDNNLKNRVQTYLGDM